MFDKAIFLDNLEYLIKEKNITARNIEEKAGVSKGYISRLKKEGNMSVPGIEFVLTVSSLTGVSVEVLSTINLSQCSESEDYYIRFVDRLIEKTVRKDVRWRAKSLYEFKDNPNGQSDNNVIFERTPSWGESFVEMLNGQYKYRSSYDYGEYSFIETEGDFYCFKMDYTNVLYLVKVKLKKDDDIFEGMELFIVSDKKSKLDICCIAPERPKKYDDLLCKLYNTIKDLMSEGILDEDARTAINNFMKSDFKKPKS